jgi:glycosyltransferase involved in cell wall biosynthesis
MKKVLYLIDTLEVGGAETSILEIASRLKMWDPVVVYIYSGNALQEKFENVGIKVYALNINAKFGFLKATKELSEIISKEQPNIIHATLFKAELLSRIVGKKFNIPIINSFVNDSYARERYEFLNIKQRFILNVYKFVDRITSKRVTQFMSITKAIIVGNAKSLNIDPRKVKVIYRGRNIQALRNNVIKSELKELENNYGDGPIILTVSRLLIRKGYLESIQAMKRVVNSNPEVKYLIAGEGHDRRHFEKLIIQLNLERNVFLLGNRNDISSLLAFSDIFLFPSHYEGQGGALVEAMILGKPIISSKIPVIEESVKNKYSALLFEPMNIQDMCSKILWAISNKEVMKAYGENAKMVAEMRFDIQKVALQHEKMYDEVLLSLNSNC